MKTNLLFHAGFVSSTAAPVTLLSWGWVQKWFYWQSKKGALPADSEATWELLEIGRWLVRVVTGCPKTSIWLEQEWQKWKKKNIFLVN